MKIPYKIFGIAILVFAVMGSSILYSSYKLYQVNREVADLADVFIPLSDRMAAVDLEITEQQLHLERLEKHLAASRLIEAELQALRVSIVPEQSQADGETAAERRSRLEAEHAALAETIALEEMDFERREANIDAAILSAEQLIERATGRAGTQAGRDALKTLLPLLQSVDLQHSNLHGQMTLLIAAYKRNSPMRFELGRLIEEEEDRLADHMHQAWQRIARFTENAAKTAEEHERQALVVNLVLAASAGALALVLAGFVIRGMLRPLRRLTRGTQNVQSGDLTGEIAADTHDEIGDLIRSFNHMVQELRKTEQIKETFGQYVDPRVVSGLLGDPQMQMVNGEKKVVSVFFADLTNFAGISERFTPGGLVKLINRFLELMSEPVTGHSGLIDKYIGDAIMAFWAPPFCADGKQAPLAVEAALDDLRLIDQFRDELPELLGLQRDLPVVGMRIGIATGDAVVGSIGSQKTKNYTVIGDTVNLGSRLESANKVYGTSILVCGRTRDMASGAFEFRKIDDLIVFGKTEPVSIFEPLGAIGTVAEAALDHRVRFERALRDFQSGDWNAAKTGFMACREAPGDDPAAETYLRRLAIIEENGPPADWDGVWRLNDK